MVVDGYKGNSINWSSIQEKREQIIEGCKSGSLPDGCQGCYCLETKDWESNPKLKVLEIYHWIHCNCGCIYCSNLYDTNGAISPEIKKSEYYNLLPILKEIIENDMLDSDVGVSFGGGEPAVLEEICGLLELFRENGARYIYLPTSGVLYSDAIAKAMDSGNLSVTISIDSGTPEVYHKIKRTDSFYVVLDNIKKYIKASPFAVQSITLKYIILDKINDNVQEIEKWLLIASGLGLKYVSLSLEYSHSVHEKKGQGVPKHFYELFEYGKKRCEELNLIMNEYDSVNQILARGHY